MTCRKCGKVFWRQSDDPTKAIEGDPKDESYPEENLAEFEFECEVWGKHSELRIRTATKTLFITY